MIPSQLDFSSNSTGLRKARSLKHILLVGIEEEHRLLLAALLQAEGHLVSVSCTDIEALRRLQQGNIEFVIIDHFAPELDGLSLLEEIKSLNTGHPGSHPLFSIRDGALHDSDESGSTGLLQQTSRLHERAANCEYACGIWAESTDELHAVNFFKKTSFRTLFQTLGTEPQSA